MSFKVYIASKESDIDPRNNYYQHKIVYYGTKNETTDVFCSDFRCDIHYKPHFLNFVIEKMREIIKRQSDCLFFFYAPKLSCIVVENAPELKKYIPCFNKYSTLTFIDNKLLSREWLKSLIPITSFELHTWADCCSFSRTLSELTDDGIVLQYANSCGGEGSFIYPNSSLISLCNETFSNDDLFIISPYLEKSITACCHIIIYENDILVFPPNICNSYKSTETCMYRPIYCGSDYISAMNLPNLIKSRIIELSNTIGSKLSNIGYRGVCGIDFLVDDKNVFMLEINPRYQGSSFLVDAALIDNQLPPLAFFQEQAFTCKTPLREHKNIISQMIIPYKSIVYTYNECTIEHELETAFHNQMFNQRLCADGFDINVPVSKYERNTYLFIIIEKDIKYINQTQSGFSNDL